MPDNGAQLKLSVDAGPGADAEESAEFARQLRETLLDLDVDQVALAQTGEAPAGSKGIPIDWSTLLVTLAASGSALTAVINTVQSWLSRQGQQSVTLEMGGDKLILTGASSQQQQELVDNWIRRHSAR
jgi:Effector Associated Constant Component 1